MHDTTTAAVLGKKIITELRDKRTCSIRSDPTTGITLNDSHVQYQVNCNVKNQVLW